MIHREGSDLKRGVALSLLDYSENVIKDTETVARRLTKAANAAKMSAEIEREILKNAGESEDTIVFTRAAAIHETLIASVRSNTMAIYKTVQRASVPEDFQEDFDNADSGKSELLGEESVLVRLENDGIFVKTPLLWSKKIGQDRAIFFRKEISEGIKNAANFESYDLSRYAEKTFQYLHIYHSEPSQKMFSIDNDAYEIKYVQDAIAMYLPGGDSPFSAFIFSASVVSEAIPEGTYISVVPSHTKLIPSKNLIKFWSKILAE